MSADASLEMHPVSTEVNSVRNNRPELVNKIDPNAASSNPQALF
jgi:putative SOS response-associated peptidase YedK